MAAVQRSETVRVVRPVEVTPVGAFGDRSALPSHLLPLMRQFSGSACEPVGDEPEAVRLGGAAGPHRAVVVRVDHGHVVAGGGDRAVVAVAHDLAGRQVELERPAGDRRGGGVGDHVLVHAPRAVVRGREGRGQAGDGMGRRAGHHGQETAAEDADGERAEHPPGLSESDRHRGTSVPLGNFPISFRDGSRLVKGPCVRPVPPPQARLIRPRRPGACHT